MSPTPANLAADLDVRPLTTRIGAEIHGIDLATDLDEPTVAAVRRALLHWKVVFFRDQTISLADQVRFGRRFGDVTPAHPTLPGLTEAPEVLSLDSRLYQQAASRIAAAGGDRSAGADLVGEYVDNRWHTDVTFVVNPPAASILHGVVVPPYGGDTSWSDLVAAYEDLADPVRRTIDGLQALHTNALETIGGGTNALASQFASSRYASIHPVVRVHPETGERALFVNPGFTRRILGVSHRESDALLRILFAQVARTAFTVRFRWRPGSVAFWDNRATAHRGPGDLAHLGFDRVVQRITLAGDVPVGPDGTASRAVEGTPFLAADSAA